MHHVSHGEQYCKEFHLRTDLILEHLVLFHSVISAKSLFFIWLEQYRCSPTLIVHNNGRRVGGDFLLSSRVEAAQFTYDVIHIITGRQVSDSYWSLHCKSFRHILSVRKKAFQKAFQILLASLPEYKRLKAVLRISSCNVFWKKRGNRRNTTLRNSGSQALRGHHSPSSFFGKFVIVFWWSNSSDRKLLMIIRLLLPIIPLVYMRHLFSNHIFYHIFDGGIGWLMLQFCGKSQKSIFWWSEWYEMWKLIWLVPVIVFFDKILVWVIVL